MELSERATFLQHCQSALGDIYDKIKKLEAIPLDSLPPQETLVISVDMNRGFCYGGNLYSKRVQDILPATGVFFDRCIEGQYALLAFSDRHGPDSPELKSYPEHCMADSAEWELADEISRLRPFTLFKNSSNSFFAGLEAKITPEMRRFVITGCCTDICIYQLALTLKTYCNQHNREAQVIVPLALVETYDAPWHSADLTNAVFVDSMLANGVEVVKDLL